MLICGFLYLQWASVIHLPLKDRARAGQLLAKKLAQSKVDPDSVVLGILRGGVPVACEVARALQLPWDILIVRKLGVPGREELGFGAIASGGRQFIDQSLVDTLHLSPTEVEEVVRHAEAEVARREKLYRGERHPVSVNGKTAVLVDDGLATGSTMVVAIQAAREMGAESVIAAAPVSSREACDLCKDEGASCVCLAAPDPFHAVGEWYEDFSQVTDDDVRKLIAES